MPEDNVAPPTGPNADSPRGAPPKAPKAIAEGKGPISFGGSLDKLDVDGMQQPHPADATHPDRGEQPYPSPFENTGVVPPEGKQRIAESRVAENEDAFKSGSDNASV